MEEFEMEAKAVKEPLIYTSAVPLMQFLNVQRQLMVL